MFLKVLLQPFTFCFWIIGAAINWLKDTFTLKNEEEFGIIHAIFFSIFVIFFTLLDVKAKAQIQVHICIFVLVKEAGDRFKCFVGLVAVIIATRAIIWMICFGDIHVF